MPSNKRGGKAAARHGASSREDSGTAASPLREASLGLDDLTRNMSQLRVVGERTANWTLDVASANAEEDDKTAKGDAKRNGKAKQAASTVISSSAAPSAASGLYTLPSSSASRSTAASKRESASNHSVIVLYTCRQVCQKSGHALQATAGCTRAIPPQTMVMIRTTSQT